MRKYSHTVSAALVLLGLAGVWQPGKAQEKAAGRTLKVKVHYSGAGAVDEKHKIFLFLFDSPDFLQQHDVMPIAAGTAAGKDETVTFPDLAKSPVYLIAAYDPAGGYQGTGGPPPTGSSLGMYGKTPGQVEPITIDAGKSAQIDLAFDDSVKMP